MQMMTKEHNLYASRTVSTFIAVFSCGLSALGCGSNSEVNAGERIPQAHPRSIEACLERSGAHRATELRDLAFLTVAEANEEVSKPGLAYDRVTNTVVRIWQGAIKEEHPPGWSIWFGQPFEEDRGPREIAVDGSQGTFVMYVNRPSGKLRRMADDCFERKGEKHVKPSLHSVTH